MMKKHHKGGRKWQEKLEEANLLNKFKDISRSFCMISHTLNLDMFLFPTLNFFNLNLPCLITRADIHLMQSKFSFVLIFHEGNISLLSRFIFFSSYDGFFIQWILTMIYVTLFHFVWYYLIMFGVTIISML